MSGFMDGDLFPRIDILGKRNDVIVTYSAIISVILFVQKFS